MVIWQLYEAPEIVLQAARRSVPASPFSSPEQVAPPSTDLVPAPVVAVGGGGEAVVAWSDQAGSENVVLASFGRPGAAFSVPATISAPSPEFLRPAAAIDAAGDATVLWPRSDGSNEIVQYAGYDAFPPRLGGVSIPASGTVGVPVSFAATPFDVWPIAPVSFDFGDGATAAGNSVSHTYTAPGAYRVSLLAKDAAGTPVEASGSITIAPSNAFRLGKLKLNRRRGTATLTVELPGPGEVVLSGAGVATAKAQARRAGALKLPVRLRGKGRRRLRTRGRLKLRLRVAFTPTGEAPRCARARRR